MLTQEKCRAEKLSTKFRRLNLYSAVSRKSHKYYWHKILKKFCVEGYRNIL